MRLLALVLAAALLPVASAGSERAPEIASPKDRPNPAGDILAVWFEDDTDGLAITFKVGALSDRQASLVYYVNLDIHDVIVSPAVGFDGRGDLRTDSGANPAGWGNGRLDDEPVIQRIERGTPAYVTILVPWGMYDLQPGDHVHPLSAMSAMCCDRIGGGWYTPYDQAQSQVEQVEVNAPSLYAAMGFPILVPSWVIPLIVAGCTLAGAGAGGALAFTTRAKPRAVPVSTREPVSAARPPGERFQHAPGKRV